MILKSKCFYHLEFVDEDEDDDAFFCQFPLSTLILFSADPAVVLSSLTASNELNFRFAFPSNHVFQI
jgi:hypothetical protein